MEYIQCSYFGDFPKCVWHRNIPKYRTKTKYAVFFGSAWRHAPSLCVLFFHTPLQLCKTAINGDFRTGRVCRPVGQVEHGICNFVGFAKATHGDH